MSENFWLEFPIIWFRNFASSFFFVFSKPVFRAGLLEVMMTLDGDGNGEVDFDEFLKLMTDTEMFIEAIAKVSTCF